MIVTKNGVAFPLSRNVVFAIVLISVILVASTAAVTYAVLSSQGKIGFVNIVDMKTTKPQQPAITVVCYEMMISVIPAIIKTLKISFSMMKASKK